MSRESESVKLVREIRRQIYEEEKKIGAEEARRRQRIRVESVLSKYGKKIEGRKRVART